VVAVVVDRDDIAGRIDGFGLIVPRREGRAALALSFSSLKYAGRAPAGQLLIRVFLGGALDPNMIARSDGELEQVAQGELRELLGWRGSAPRWMSVIRWPESMPQYLIGHVERM